MLLEPIKDVKIDLATSYYPFSADNANCILVSQFVEPTGKEIWWEHDYQLWLQNTYAGNFQAFLDDLATFDGPLRIYMDHQNVSEFLYDYFASVAANFGRITQDNLYSLICQRAAVDLTHLVSPPAKEIQTQLDGWTHFERDMSNYTPNVGAISKLVAPKLPFEYLLSDYMLKTDQSPYYEYFVSAFKDLIRLRFFHDMRRLKDYMIYRTDKEDIEEDIRNDEGLRLVEHMGQEANDIDAYFMKYTMDDLFNLIEKSCWLDFDRYAIKFRMRAMVEAYWESDFHSIVMDRDFWMELSTVVPLRLKINFRHINLILKGRVLVDLPDPVEPIGTPILVNKKKVIDVSEGVQRDISNAMMGQGRLRYPYAKPGQ